MNASPKNPIKAGALCWVMCSSRNWEALGATVTSTQDINSGGYVMGGEYRFYLKKENKYAALHGVYIGPYTNFFSFRNERLLNLLGSDGVTLTQANLNTNIHALNIGVQLGYQFVIKDRWTFDMVFMGPSISNYGLSSKLTGDISQEAILENEILAALVDRFPLLKDLLEGQTVNLQGSNNKWATGFRYQFNIGYRFGAKKSR